LIIDFVLSIHFIATVQFEARKLFEFAGYLLTKGLTQSTHKIEIARVSARLFAILIASWSLLSGCADTKQAAQGDSNSIFRKSESDHEVHGEVGVMYGHSAR
jgi:hypothetical protein